VDGPPRDRWVAALLEHERAIDRLRGEIAMLERERETCGEPVVCGILRLQIEFANVQLMRHRIGAELLAARLGSSA
jgi:hypothetical protein